MDDDAETRQAIAQARLFGMDDASIARLRLQLGQSRSEFDGIWPDNAAIVAAFFAVKTQWRIVMLNRGFAPSQPIYLGLDYASARVALDAEAITVTPDLWRGLRAMEIAACAVLNESNR